ncbi:MAG: N-acetylmuramoyl-L-alanine amidase [Calditrichaeota bacterium]|nr:N-acetylmuramoyl-L-alanine amidase [Calditrichota bacterium]
MHSMKILAAVACLLSAALIPLYASSLLLTDEQGTPLGRVPYLEQGEERFVPLLAIASKSGWTLTNEAGVEILRVDTLLLRARRSNPFYFFNNDCRQFAGIPQEWDGTLWVPLSEFMSVFPPELFRQNPQDGSLCVRKIVEIEKPVAPPKAPKGEPRREKTSALPSIWTMNTVIIDPGHGGKDPGAIGASGVCEKDVVLDISRHLAKMLLEKGLTAKMTRYDDRFVPLAERTKFANSSRGDLFVSVHCNSSKIRSARGAEAYFLSPARTESAIEVALCENSVVELEDNAGQYQDLTEENYILLTMATSQYLKDSEHFAKLALKEVSRNTVLPQRWVDQAGFYILIGASMPAILLEVGYLSNPEDESFLSTKRGRQKVAEALARAILEMKSRLETEASR